MEDLRVIRDPGQDHYADQSFLKELRVQHHHR